MDLTGLRVTVSNVGGTVWRKDPFNKGRWHVLWDDGEDCPPTREVFFEDGSMDIGTPFCPVCGDDLDVFDNVLTCCNCNFKLEIKGVYHADNPEA